MRGCQQGFRSQIGAFVEIQERLGHKSCEISVGLRGGEMQDEGRVKWVNAAGIQRERDRSAGHAAVSIGQRPESGRSAVKAGMGRDTG